MGKKRYEKHGKEKVQKKNDRTLSLFVSGERTSSAALASGSFGDTGSLGDAVSDLTPTPTSKNKRKNNEAIN